MFVRIANLSARALAGDGQVKTTEFLAACSEVLPIVGELHATCCLDLKRPCSSRGAGAGKSRPTWPVQRPPARMRKHVLLVPVS